MRRAIGQKCWFLNFRRLRSPSERAAATRPRQLSYIRNLVLFQESWCFYGKWIFGSKVVVRLHFYFTGLGVVFLNGFSLISNAGVTNGVGVGVVVILSRVRNA